MNERSNLRDRCSCKHVTTRVYWLLYIHWLLYIQVFAVLSLPHPVVSIIDRRYRPPKFGNIDALPLSRLVKNPLSVT